jgi:hypothetical protein
MIANKFYKHKNNTEVVFEVLNFHGGAVIFSVRGKWWNIQSVKPFPITDDFIQIRKEDLNNWEEYSLTSFTK